VGVFLNNFFFDDDNTVESQVPNNSAPEFILEKALETEAIAFTELISNNQLLDSSKNSSILWQKYTIKLPKPSLL